MCVIREPEFIAMKKYFTWSIVQDKIQFAIDAIGNGPVIGSWPT